jgi:hypothetical protein
LALLKLEARQIRALTCCLHRTPVGTSAAALWPPQQTARIGRRPTCNARASRALAWAWNAGTRHLRTHINWWQPDEAPVAWQVVDALKDEWAGSVAPEKVAQCPLAFFDDPVQARTVLLRIPASGPGALPGAFVHSTRWNPDALRHLLVGAQELGLDVDLHVDEELAPKPAAWRARRAYCTRSASRVVSSAATPRRAGTGTRAGHAGCRGARADHDGVAADGQSAAAGCRGRPHAAPARHHTHQGGDRARHSRCCSRATACRTRSAGSAA